MEQQHIVTAFDEELERMRTGISQMGGLVEAQLSDAVRAIGRLDVELATRVRESDRRVDDFEAEIGALVIRLLALRQPVAADLRSIVSALKITSDLERMGDYAANIAKRATALAQLPEVAPLSGLTRMGRLTQTLIKDVLDAYCNGDVDAAVDAWRRDEEIDEMYTSLFREFLTYMMEDPRNISPCTHLLFVAKNLERIGDHATNIAETLYYQEKGERLDGSRPKGDTSSFTVIEPPAC